MTTNEPILGTDLAVLRNGDATMPTTHASRVSVSVLLRASSDVGYAAIGRAVGHDKSWVSRFFSGQALISFPELLHWFDVASLSISNANGDAVEDAASDLMQALSGELKELDGREISQVEARAAVKLLRAMLARDGV